MRVLELEPSTLMEYFILYSFLAFCVLQLFWVFYFYTRIAFHKHKKSDHFPPVSVIITARNEEDNLFRLLPSVLEQNYADFEVIVVNHQSSDDSAHILKAFARQYPRLKVIELERSKHLRNGKKLPLTIAIKGAKYNHLLFTDADCEPSSKLWLEQMANQFSEKKEMVLGYGPYRKEKGMLNRIIRLDTVMIALNYLSFAKGGVPYMGVGRNMGYTKELFLKNNGFKSHYAIQSGDDDLFVQEVAKKRNYTVCLTPNAFCYSEAKKSWGEWYKQKSRHFTTTSHYGVIKKTLLGIYPLSLILMYISFAILCLNYFLSYWVIGVFAGVVTLKWIIQGRALAKLAEKDFAWIFPFWDVVYAVLAPLIYYTSEKSTEAKWK